MWKLSLLSAACWLAGSFSVFSNITHAEPVAQIPLGEFKVMLSNVDRLQKREKLQAEMITHLKEKDQLHTDYIAKLEAADEQREKYVEKLEQIANDPRWAQRLEWAGYGAAVPTAVMVIRKLVLKW